VLLGVLAVAAIPIAVGAAWVSPAIALLRSLEIGVPAAFVLGLVAVSVARRARYRVERTVARPGAGVVRAARFLAWTGLYFAATGAIALGFYGLLVARG
jgi:hypothetical protein